MGLMKANSKATYPKARQHGVPHHSWAPGYPELVAFCGDIVHHHPVAEQEQKSNCSAPSTDGKQIVGPDQCSGVDGCPHRLPAGFCVCINLRFERGTGVVLVGMVRLEAIRPAYFERTMLFRVPEMAAP